MIKRVLEFMRLTILVVFLIHLLTDGPMVYSKEDPVDDWITLFDGKSLDGWMTSGQKPSLVPVEDGAINPHGCGDYMMIHNSIWSDFILSLDFKISPKCNSGIFIRTYPLDVVPGWDVGYNGIEMAIDDTTTAGFVDTGALYDLSKPSRNLMKPVGEWNHVEITCDGPMISIVLNGEKVNSINLDEWTEPGKRPDGSEHKFGKVMASHPRKGYIGLQDHGSPCWYRNIRIRPLH